ncbi:hypothetical protein QNM99_24680 [Pseudomonas sp. PCH446]
MAAIERLLAYFSASARTHLRIAPEDIDESEVGISLFSAVSTSKSSGRLRCTGWRTVNYGRERRGRLELRRLTEDNCSLTSL